MKRGHQYAHNKAHAIQQACSVARLSQNTTIQKEKNVRNGESAHVVTEKKKS